MWNLVEDSQEKDYTRRHMPYDTDECITLTCLLLRIESENLFLEKVKKNFHHPNFYCLSSLTSETSLFYVLIRILFFDKSCLNIVGM